MATPPNDTHHVMTSISNYTYWVMATLPNGTHHIMTSSSNYTHHLMATPLNGTHHILTSSSNYTHHLTVTPPNCTNHIMTSSLNCTHHIMATPYTIKWYSPHHGYTIHHQMALTTSLLHNTPSNGTHHIMTLSLNCILHIMATPYTIEVVLTTSWLHHTPLKWYSPHHGYTIHH